MNIKNYINAAMMALVLTGVSSCGKKLELDPKQNIDASTAIKTDSDVDQLTIGAYAVLEDPALYGTMLIMLPELYATDKSASAKYLGWVGSFDTPREVANKKISTINGDITRVWVQSYRAINLANTILASMGVVKDPALQKSLKGEALFIRALLQFELVRLYGQQWTGGPAGANTQPGVPIVTKASSDDAIASQKYKRNTVAEVYNASIQDLKDAITLLPADNPGRANQYAAMSILARVYLQQGDYANALTLANQVISSTKFSLNSDVTTVFRTKNTAESIWEIQQNDQNNAGNANDGLATFYANLDGGLGRADFFVSAGFKATFDPNDSRGNTLIYTGSGAKPGNLACGKYLAYGQNIPIVRLSELYLVRAECNIRLGSVVGDTPAKDLAQVRGRTGAAPIPVPTLNNIINERVFELFGEGFAVHDLKRLNLPTYGGIPFNDKTMVFPVPQREINVNSNLAQNDGYN